MSGYLEWSMRFLRTPALLGSYQLTEAFVSLTGGSETAGTSIALLGGGHVYQRTPAHRYAPLDLQGESFQLAFQVAAEEDYHRLRRLRSLAQDAPVPFFAEYPHEDVWVIPPAEQTTWTLSRSLPFAAFPFATYMPTAWIVDRPGGFDEEPLTVTDTPPVAAGQLAIDSAMPDSVTTTDLSAHAGRLLVLRYHPMRQVVIEGMSTNVPVVNGLDVTVELREHVPMRTYAGPVE